MASACRRACAYGPAAGLPWGSGDDGRAAIRGGGDRQERRRAAPAAARPPKARQQGPHGAVGRRVGRPRGGRRPAGATAAIARRRASARALAAAPRSGRGEEGGAAMRGGATGESDGGQRLSPRVRPWGGTGAPVGQWGGRGSDQPARVRAPISGRLPGHLLDECGGAGQWIGRR